MSRLSKAEDVRGRETKWDYAAGPNCTADCCSISERHLENVVMLDGMYSPAVLV